MTNWNGDSTDLAQGDSVNMDQTSNGSMVLGYRNKTKDNSAGTLQVASGGSRPETENVPAGSNQTEVIVRNWHAQNLKLTNTSDKNSLIITVNAIGPGYGTEAPVALPMDGTKLPLDPNKSAQGNALPQWLTLRLQATSGQETIFALIGGPTQTEGDINAYTFMLNATVNQDPAKEGVPVADGYYAKTTGNTIDFQFNWGSSRVWIANFSGDTAATATLQVLGAT